MLIAGWSGIALLFALLWVTQRRTGNAGIVDIGWAGSIGLLVLYYAMILPCPVSRRALVAVLACAWSFRLASYLFRRNVGKPEDGRYKDLRESWGASAQWKLFVFFELQALTVILLSLPALVAMRNPNPSNAWSVSAVLLLILSVGGETLADMQRARFKSNPANRGRTCRAGLWGYSRHPNYFFEWLHWWVYVLLAIGSPWVWATWLAPAAMLYVLVKATGIPATEAQAVATRGDDYREYQRTTSAFVPWFPKKG